MILIELKGRCWRIKVEHIKLINQMTRKSYVKWDEKQGNTLYSSEILLPSLWPPKKDYKDSLSFLYSLNIYI